jgi:signal transduction histidine kinase
MHKPVASENNLKFNLLRYTNESVLFADAYSVEQILNHLIDNALKFTKSGSVSVTVDKDETNKIVISVEFTGIGM